MATGGRSKSGTVSGSFRQQKPNVPNRGASAAKKEPQQSAPDQAASTSTAGPHVDEELQLRQFDLTSKYGPCVGMTRLERWERAEEFGLAPPTAVRDIILAQGGEDSAVNHPIWQGRV